MNTEATEITFMILGGTASVVTLLAAIRKSILESLSKKNRPTWR